MPPMPLSEDQAHIARPVRLYAWGCRRSVARPPAAHPCYRSSAKCHLPQLPGQCTAWAVIEVGLPPQCSAPTY
eukprot:12844136-Alexandrium_andersonii.AAC.1